MDLREARTKFDQHLRRGTFAILQVPEIAHNMDSSGLGWGPRKHGVARSRQPAEHRAAAGRAPSRSAGASRRTLPTLLASVIGSGE
jgi:hypothetical protein